MPYADKRARTEYQRQWIAKRRTDYLQDKSCARCGSANRLEIDHIDPALKVSHRIWSWSLERRNQELAKCQVLCFDCHLEKTISENQTSRCGDASMYRRGCRCDKCTNAHRLRIQKFRSTKRNLEASC